MIPIATTGIVADDLLSFAILENSAGNIVSPIVLVITRNTTASAVVETIVPRPTDPRSTTRVITVKIIRPKTSSATAAPRTIRASTVASARKSPNTRAVMPMLVAVSAAPKNNEGIISLPNKTPVPIPKTIGAKIPIKPTNKEARPTFFNSTTSVSRPTWSNKIITPSSDITYKISLAFTKPRTELPIKIPAKISPITAGIASRSETSAAILATIKIIAKSSNTRLISRPPSALVAAELPKKYTKSVFTMRLTIRVLCCGSFNSLCKLRADCELLHCKVVTHGLLGSKSARLFEC